MLCPVCREKYAFFEKRCTRCNVDLVPEAEADVKPLEANDPPDPIHPQLRMNEYLVSVFKTDDPAVIPLATMALEAEGIEYLVTNSGKVDTMDWVMSQKPTTRPVVVEIKVGGADAEKARELLVDLEQSKELTTPSDESVTAEALSSDPPTVRLEDASTGAAVGAITESQLQEVTSRLEEDAPQQYFITGDTVDMLQNAEVDPKLVEILRKAVGSGGDGVALRWTVR